MGTQIPKYVSERLTIHGIIQYSRLLDLAQLYDQYTDGNSVRSPRGYDMNGDKHISPHVYDSIGHQIASIYVQECGLFVEEPSYDDINRERDDLSYAMIQLCFTVARYHQSHYAMKRAEYTHWCAIIHAIRCSEPIFHMKRTVGRWIVACLDRSGGPTFENDRKWTGMLQWFMYVCNQKSTLSASSNDLWHVAEHLHANVLNACMFDYGGSAGGGHHNHTITDINSRSHPFQIAISTYRFVYMNESSLTTDEQAELHNTSPMSYIFVRNRRRILGEVLENNDIVANDDSITIQLTFIESTARAAMHLYAQGQMTSDCAISLLKQLVQHTERIIGIHMYQRFLPHFVLGFVYMRSKSGLVPQVICVHASSL